MYLHRCRLICRKQYSGLFIVTEAGRVNADFIGSDRQEREDKATVASGLHFARQARLRISCLVPLYEFAITWV